MTKSDSPENLLYEVLNKYQKSFPLASQPFAVIAAEMGLTEAEVLTIFRQAQDLKYLSRVGAVIRPNSVGVSTLAAMNVPSARRDELAQFLNSYSQVNHNYEREDVWNFWFVVTAPDEQELSQVLRDIEVRTGIPVLDLRLEEEFRIDLGFDFVSTLQAGGR